MITNLSYQLISARTPADMEGLTEVWEGKICKNILRGSYQYEYVWKECSVLR